jgi:hypothetical protein
MMRNDGGLARSANTQAVPLAAGWSWPTCYSPGEGAMLAVMTAISGWKGYRPDRYDGG